MKKVITYGTYDTLHYGHIALLERARALGDYLVVGLSSEEFNLEKNKTTCFEYEQRRKMLSAIRYVDLIIPETCWEQKRRDIEKHAIDIFVMGDDWKGKFDDLSNACEVIYLPRTPAVSSTAIREKLEEELLTEQTDKETQK